MPRRNDIHSILIIGSGPIVIGQGCEFDYSGVQACRALKEEGYRVVLINSNPATIMTDPEFADATYIEPITPECVEKILDREQKQGTPIDAVLPTLGGQTGLNTALACYDKGIFTRFNVKMIGANREAIFKGEDRKVFKDLMLKIGLKVPRSGVVHSLDEGRKVLDEIGLPLIIRPAFTLGGTGGGIAYNIEEFDQTVQRGLDASPVTEVLIEQSVIGWKEYELEVMRDRNDNVVIICSIENLDAMGVHTGDSITVAPVQTLTDKEYQRMRDAAIAVIRAVGVETGGSNIQFAVNPANGEMIVVEMNPRVSRSSALASKATGYPIAKMAAKLAVGYTLDELSNDITTRKRTPPPSSNPQSAIQNPKSDYDLFTSACFEPTIDYCVIKIPRWTFEKFPDADETLTTQMKSVGEAMAIGRTFKEALQKGIRSMEVKRFGFGLDRYDKWLNSSRVAGVSPASSPKRERDARDTDNDKTTQGESLDHEWPIPEEKLTRKLAVPSQGRLYYLRYAMQMGWTLDRIHKLTGIDPWFLNQMKELTDFETQLFAASKHVRHPWSKEIIDLVRQAKQWGYSDVQLANVWNMSPSEFRNLRMHVMKPVYKLVDTCAAEFEATTPYYYSTYELPYHRLPQPVGATPASPSSLYSGGSGSVPTSFLSPTEREVGPAGSNQVVDDEIRLTTKDKVIIIGGGPNRIGQGIEFDYCCVQAAFAMKELGLESVMVNSNPETVSTDYDTSDLLFFEPLTHEDILNICERLNGGTFVKSEILIDYTRGAKSLEDVIPHALNLTRLSFSATDHERQLIEDHLRRDNVERAGIVGSVVSPAMPQETCKVLFVMTAPNSVWTFSFSGEEPSRLLNAVELSHVERKQVSVMLDPDALERARQGLSSTHFPAEGRVKGVIVQFGGQTPLNLAKGLSQAGVPIIGTSVESLDAAGDRELFRDLLQKLGLKQPENGIARNIAEARDIAKRVGYPVLVRPSFVLGGRAMEIVSDEEQLNYYMTHAVEASTIKDAPILVDKFLDNATEVDVDCLADFEPLATSNQQPATAQAIIIGVMEHIEEAGIHSGDSACALPPYSLSKEIVARLKDQTRSLAKALRVNGLMNVQYAIKDNDIYVIEVNPRASRTVPFVSKATGISWAKIAAKVMAGKSLTELGIKEQPDPKHTSVKEVVFPFTKFPGVDVILGPEMRSTGEVMGIDNDFPLAFAKSQIAAGSALPTKGAVFISVNDRDKAAIIPIAKALRDSGFELLTSSGTHDVLAKSGIESKSIAKLSEGRPNIKDYIKNAGLQLIINTPTRKGPQTDEGKIRALAVLNRVPIVTTLAGALAASKAIRALQGGEWSVKPLQAYHAAK